MTQEIKLHIEERDSMSLLGLMLGGVLEANLKTDQGRTSARKLRGSLGVTGGKMKITMQFAEGGITIVRGHSENLTARVRGSLDGLLQVSLGRGAIRSFLAGEVGFSGNPFFVLKVLPLMRVQNGRGAPSNDS